MLPDKDNIPLHYIEPWLCKNKAAFCGEESEREKLSVVVTCPFLAALYNVVGINGIHKMM